MADFTNNTPFSRYALSTDPNIIVDQSVKQAWDDTRDKNPFMSFLHMLEGKTKYGPKKTKKIFFGIGDYFSTAATLSVVLAYNATEMKLTEDRFFAGDFFYLYDTASAKFANVRINNVIAAGHYGITVLVTDAVATFPTATTTVTLMNSAVPNDGKARPFLGKKGDLGLNYMQRGRDTVGMGKAEAAEQFIIEHDLPSLTRKAFEFYAEKKELSAFFNFVARGTQNENYGYNITGGCPYFYNPAGIAFADGSVGVRTMASEDFSGTNKVISSANFTYSGLRSWLYDMTLHGSMDKVINLSGATFELLVQLLEKQITVTDKDLRMLVPSMPSPWKIPMIDFGTARAWFMVNRSLDGKYMPITVGGVTSDPDKWMLANDPNHIGYVPLDMAGKVMTPHIANITPVDNDSVEKVEYDSFDTLVIDEPRSGGYLGLYTS